MLSILLLGSPGFVLDGQVVKGIRRKNAALIYYVAAQRESVSRDRLLAFFWPDLERSTAQPVLRTMLYDLRRALNTGLAISDNTVALADEVQIDVRQFENTLMAKRAGIPELTAALALYRGNFLDGFTLSDSPEFDDWAAVERERCRRLAVRGFTELAHCHEQSRRFSAALDALRHALTLDPLQEDVQRSALRLHYLSGDLAFQADAPFLVALA